MSIIKFKCKTIEPIIISGRVRKNIIESANRIPASTVRGALIKKIVVDTIGPINDINKIEANDATSKKLRDLVLRPKIRVSPLTYIIDGKETHIAHIFFCDRKIKSEDSSKIFSTLREKNDLVSFIKNERIEEYHRFIPDIKESYPKSIVGELLIKKNGEYEKINLKKWFYQNVAINHVHRISESGKLKSLRLGETREIGAGLLFSYEAFQPGIEFRFHIVDLENQLAPLLERYGGEIEILIGRGVSRGFGLTKCIFEIEDLENELIEEDYLIVDNTVLGKAISPVFSIVSPETTRPFVSRVKIENNYVSGTIILKEIKDYEGDLIPAVFAKKIVVKSWAYGYGPRPSIKAAAPGSLFVYKVNATNVKKFLRYLELVGLDDFSRLGYNYLRFFRNGDHV